MSALSDLLVSHIPDGWSWRRVGREAESRGHAMSSATTSKYLGGRHGVPSESVLLAFSDVLAIPIEKLREAARVPVGEEPPYVPPAEANRLDRRQRAAVDELIRSIVDAGDARMQATARRYAAQLDDDLPPGAAAALRAAEANERSAHVAGRDPE